MELDPGAEVEVTELHRGQAVLEHAEDVLWLEVTVGDPLGVEELQSGDHIGDDGGCLLLSEDSPLLDVVQKLASRYFLKHQVKLVCLIKILDKLDDVLVTLTSMEEVNLLEDPAPAVRRNLVDNLYCVLDPGEDVDAVLNPGVGPLSQDLAQAVQLLEGVRGKTGGRWRFLLPPSGEDGSLFPGRGREIIRKRERRVGAR